MNVDFEIEHLGKKVVKVLGDYVPNREESPLNLTADFDGANLNVAEPFLDKYVGDLNAEAEGNFRITGELKSPILNGKGKLKNGAVTILYLNTVYTFEGDIFFEEDNIGVNGLQLRDHQNNLASLSGGIFHDGFTNFLLNISGSMNAFNVLNTTDKDSDLYYGVANVTGDIQMLGTFSNMSISSKVRSDKGTKIFIPIGGTSSVQQEDYIHFISRRDSSNIREESDKIDLKRYQVRS